MLDSLARTRGVPLLKTRTPDSGKADGNATTGLPSSASGLLADGPAPGCQAAEPHSCCRNRSQKQDPALAQSSQNDQNKCDASCLQAGWLAGTQVSTGPQDPQSLPHGPDCTPASLDASRQKPCAAAHTGDRASFLNAGQPPGQPGRPNPCSRLCGPPRAPELTMLRCSALWRWRWQRDGFQLLALQHPYQPDIA